MTLSIVASPGHAALAPSPVALLRTRDVPHAERWVNAGELVRVHRGVVVSTADWTAAKPWERYLARVHAVLMTRPSAVPCMESSAALLGMPVFGDPRVVHLLDDAVAGSRLIGGVRMHTTRDRREIVEIDGIRLVGAVDTAVDIARRRHHAVGLSVADAALRSSPSIRLEVLVAANESRLDARGRRHARWVTHRATAVAETVLESVSRAAVEWLGFDQPELQRTFTTAAHRDRVDMWWEGERIIGEADGDLKYDGSLGPSVAAIRSEKDRDRRLSNHARGIAHWGWADIRHVDPVRDVLRRAGLRIRQSEDSRELVTLAAALSPRDPESPVSRRKGWGEPTVSASNW